MPTEDQDLADRMKQIALERSPFSEAVGIRTVSFCPDEVVGEMPVSPGLGNRNGVLHGGALMTFADNLCSTGTLLNLPEGQVTVTVESKTNFLRPIRVGDVAHGVATPVHKGRTMMVWQATISRGDGKVAAVATQTQLLVEWSGERNG
ncbi:PaaI family thioesterase [Nitratireductor sp. ZSWI3]|uniref:PaaI family thioesterase n=1 Tax=Nitratireductor sp. ZSWI3 TaxID=2966359 RepID=UPI00214F8CEB|nr:PaaI family thioesterase [Nitratireductor sp. ZSWI3]MCR4265268.1 PaaI family thioesterase [Nitratireductor sp. ZSWI3]